MVLLLYQYTKCEMNSKAFLLVDIKLSEKKAFPLKYWKLFLQL